MTALTVLGCIVLFFAFIASLKARITVEYNDEVRLSVRVLFINIKILPQKKKKSGPFSMSRKKAEKIREKLRKKAQKKKDKAKQKKDDKEKKKDLPKKKLSLDQILDIISMVKDILTVVLKKFFGHLRVDIARLKIVVATGDAATTAIYYGVICDALTHLLPLLESLKGFDTPKAKDMSVTTDFLGDGITADIKLSVSLRVWHLFHVAFAALGKAIKHLFKMQKKKAQKEGATDPHAPKKVKAK